MAEGTGIWLNNSLAYCTFEPAGNPMDAHPGRRKLSGDVPLFVMNDGKPWLVMGTPGGHTIGQTIPQVVMNLLEFGLVIQAAISAPRINFVDPEFHLVEGVIRVDVFASLGSLGHQVRGAGGIGNVHELTVQWGPDGAPEGFSGGADPRGSGLAKGR